MHVNIIVVQTELCVDMHEPHLLLFNSAELIDKLKVVQHKYTGWPKKLAHIERFSNLFYSQNQENICNNNVTKYPSTPQVCC